MSRTRTQVAIVGAGPAGLTLAALLHVAGIESVVLENRNREYVEARVRAGVLEQGTVDLLERAGAADRLRREGIVHGGIHLQFAGERHHLPMDELTGGRSIVVYGQTEVVKDLVALRLAQGLPLRFEVGDVAVHEFEGEEPYVTFVHEGDGASARLRRDRRLRRLPRHLPPRARERPPHFEREYPYGWLGILADAPPSSDELVYAHSPRGFALLSLRSATRSRLYVQVAHDEDASQWPDERVWEELRLRTALDGFTLNEGPVLEKGVTGMRSFVAEPMQHGNLFLAGDAAHIVPPTGAKGLNLAAHDVRVLADALIDFYAHGSRNALDAYSTDCLRRVWRAEHFSYWMTSMLHLSPERDPFEERLQLSQLRYVTTSLAAATSLAENYVGLEQV